MTILSGIDLNIYCYRDRFGETKGEVQTELNGAHDTDNRQTNNRIITIDVTRNLRMYKKCKNQEIKIYTTF